MTDYATLLREHTTLTCRSIDRIFLQAYVPKLQSVGQVCIFLNRQRGYPIPSSAAFGKIGQAYIEEIHRFAGENRIPVVRFAKGESKEAVAKPYMERAAEEGRGQVVMLGIAQEKASVWRSWVPKSQRHLPHPHMEWGRQMSGPINHFYFYIWDEQWGPSFLKINAYAPYPIWCCLNGHEWAKRQLARRGIGFTELDNGFLSCEDPRALQRICDSLGPGAVKSFFWSWTNALPSPLTRADRRAGYIYDLAFRQLEVSDTRVFARPASGRAFFEGMIRDHLDIGRPHQVSITFGRKVTRRTPGGFRTRVVTKGVDPRITASYKSSKVKAYFKEERALRTEVTIADTYDFGIGRRVNQANWKALRAVGEQANRRLCDAFASDAAPAPDLVTFSQVTRPSTDTDGLHAPALRFGDPRVMAILAVLCRFAFVLAGFSNRELREAVAALLLQPYGSRQATYDLRRLRRKGVIMRIPGTNRYQLTPFGREIAVFFTKVYGRVLAPGLALLDPSLPEPITSRCPLALTWRNFDRALDDFVQRQMLAA